MTMNPKATERLIGEVNEDELAVRIIETMGQCTRATANPTEALNSQTPPDVAATARATARTCILYMAECFGKAVRVQ